jgi:hypothetical protein
MKFNPESIRDSQIRSALMGGQGAAGKPAAFFKGQPTTATPGKPQVITPWPVFRPAQRALWRRKQDSNP